MLQNPGFLEKTIREDKTYFDKTAVAQQFLDILSGHGDLKVVQDLIRTLLDYSLESLKVGKLSDATLLMVPDFYTRMLLFYAQTAQPERRSLLEDLFSRPKEEQDPRMLAMQDTQFLVAMLKEAQGQGGSEERRKLVLDKLLVQLGVLATHRGIPAEHKPCIEKVAQLLLTSGDDEQDT